MEDAKGRLLAVDDNSDSAELVARVAAKCGYETQTISDPRALRRAVEEWKPEVLTLDLCMPEADGIGLLSMLEESGFGGQLVIISGQEGWLRKAAGRLASLRGSARHRRDGQARGYQGAASAPDQSAPAPGRRRPVELRRRRGRTAEMVRPGAAHPGPSICALRASFSDLYALISHLLVRRRIEPRRSRSGSPFCHPDRSWRPSGLRSADPDIGLALRIGFVLRKCVRSQRAPSRPREELAAFRSRGRTAQFGFVWGKCDNRQLPFPLRETGAGVGLCSAGPETGSVLGDGGALAKMRALAVAESRGRIWLASQNAGAHGCNSLRFWGKCDNRAVSLTNAGKDGEGSGKIIR